MNGQFEVMTAVVSLWTSAGLDSLISDMWPEADRSKFKTLHLDESPTNTPVPHATYNVQRTPGARASGRSAMAADLCTREDVVTLEIIVHTRDTASTTAMALAASIQDEIKKVYGGHHITPPQVLPLTGGSTQRNSTITGESLDSVSPDGAAATLVYSITLDTAEAG